MNIPTIQEIINTYKTETEYFLLKEHTIDDINKNYNCLIGNTKNVEKYYTSLEKLLGLQLNLQKFDIDGKNYVTNILINTIHGNFNNNCFKQEFIIVNLNDHSLLLHNKNYTTTIYDPINGENNYNNIINLFKNKFVEFKKTKEHTYIQKKTNQLKNKYIKDDNFGFCVVCTCLLLFLIKTKQISFLSGQNEKIIFDAILSFGFYLRDLKIE